MFARFLFALFSRKQAYLHCDARRIFVSRVEIFDWPDVNREMPNRRWLPTAGPDAQHRYWTTMDGWISCMQDYTPEDYDEVMDIAEISSVLDHIVEFKASVDDSSTIAVFNGDENAESVHRVFLCTSREVLLVEMEMFPGWDTEAQSMLDSYVRACELKLTE
jgi:hypothetical protein